MKMGKYIEGYLKTCYLGRTEERDKERLVNADITLIFLILLLYCYNACKLFKNFSSSTQFKF